MPNCAACRFSVIFVQGPQCLKRSPLDSSPLPDPCPLFAPCAPLELCQQCVHARWDRPYPARPRCLKQRPATRDGQCEGFCARPPAEPLACPECGNSLAVHGKQAVCPQGHRWSLRLGKKQCPDCGRPYATFGRDSDSTGCWRDVFMICPGCGWNKVELCRYVGPALGRGYRGQTWSPRTGRPLVRSGSGRR